MNTMKRAVGKGPLVASLCLSLLVVGCASYYRVSDPSTKAEYYTEEVETLKDGAVKLKDARTGSTITLQSSEVKEISSDEYKAALKAPPKPAPAAPAAAPAPAPATEPAAAPAPAPAPADPSK